MRARLELTVIAFLFAISGVRSQPSIQDGEAVDCRKLSATATPRLHQEDFPPSPRERLASILDPRTEARLQILRLFRSFEDVTFKAPKYSVAPWKVAEFEDEREVEKRQKTWMYGRAEWWSQRQDFAQLILEWRFKYPPSRMGFEWNIYCWGPPEPPTLEFGDIFDEEES
jgi:hypothetical protein